MKFKTEQEAAAFAAMKNRAAKLAGNAKNVFVTIAGPSNDFAVVELHEAREMGAAIRF